MVFVLAYRASHLNASMAKPKTTIKAINPRTFFSWEVRAIRIKITLDSNSRFPTEKGGTKATIISKVASSQAFHCRVFPGDSVLKTPFSSLYSVRWVYPGHFYPLTPSKIRGWNLQGRM